MVIEKRKVGKIEKREFGEKRSSRRKRGLNLKKTVKYLNFF
jgi:hypothetical protein